MNAPMTHRDIEELLGAFALDAVDEDERDLVDAHLRGCPRCASEIKAHWETAALLAAHGGGRAPEGVWSRIAASIEEQPPDFATLAPILPLSVGRLEPGGAGVSPPVAGNAPEVRTLPLRRVAVITTIAAALAGLLGVGLGRAGDDDPERLAIGPEYSALLNDPDAQSVWLEANGDRKARLIRGDDGTGLVMAEQMPALPEGRTYQLWALKADESKISLGVLGARPGTTAFKMVGDVVGFAITDEPGAGSPGPTTTPVAVGLVKPSGTA